MKIEIGGVYRCTSIHMGGFIVRVLHVDETNSVYGESLSDPDCYNRQSSMTFDGKPCGVWSVGAFKQLYVPMIHPGQIWKQLNEN